MGKTDFILGGSKVTADGDCSHEIKRHLLLGRKAMTNLDSILKKSLSSSDDSQLRVYKHAKTKKQAPSVHSSMFFQRKRTIFLIGIL